MRQLVLRYVLALFVTLATPWSAHSLSFVL